MEVSHSVLKISTEYPNYEGTIDKESSPFLLPSLYKFGFNHNLDDIATYVKNGVKVRYLVFAIKTSAKRKIISAWCANNKNKAFTLLKKEKIIEKLNCDNPINEHQDIISSIGVSSTPSIFLPNGELIQGYMSPEEVIQKLKN